MLHSGRAAHAAAKTQIPVPIPATMREMDQKVKTGLTRYAKNPGTFRGLQSNRSWQSSKASTNASTSCVVL